MGIKTQFKSSLKKKFHRPTTTTKKTNTKIYVLYLLERQIKKVHTTYSTFTKSYCTEAELNKDLVTVPRFLFEADFPPVVTYSKLSG